MIFPDRAFGSAAYQPDRELLRYLEGVAAFAGAELDSSIAHIR